VTSVGGREHFILFASPDPPPTTLARYFETLPQPTFGRPVISQRLSEDAVAILRGVGGLTTKPSAGDRPRLADGSVTPLSSADEIVRGMLMRKLTIENPGR
jgi:hypothetical protein